MTESIAVPRRHGRAPSIPSSAFQQVFDLHSRGLGVYRIAAELAGQGVFTTRSSVDRLLRRQAPYQGAHDGR